VEQPLTLTTFRRQLASSHRQLFSISSFFNFNRGQKNLDAL
jgi:hypothetical protein